MDNSNAITPFSFESFSVRVITDSRGEMAFVGKDACDALEYANHNDALNTHCKGVAERYPLQTAGGMQNVRIIREPDLYRLIAGSTLPSAERFEKWLFEEVLPSIRKTGSYSVKAQPRQSKAERLRANEVKEAFNCFLSIAKLCKFDGNMAILSANQATQAFTGVNPLQLMGRTSLESEGQDALLIVSEIADRLGVKTREVNPLLTKSGLQSDYRDTKDRICYELTETGKAFGVYLDTNKKHGDGAPVRQIKWRASVVTFLLEQARIDEDAE